MPVHNSDIADILNKIADLLDIEGANEYRVRSYRDAAQSIDNLSRELTDWVEEEKDLTDLPGIGSSMADKIREIVTTGDLEQLHEIESRTPEELTELLELSGLGPERVRDLHKELNINSLDDLEDAAKRHEIQKIEGFGEKTEKKIGEELERHTSGDEKRTKLIRAEEYAESFVEYLEKSDSISKIKIAGSYRRRKETVGDIDILVTCSEPETVMDRFTGYDEVDEVISKGDTKSSVRLKSGLQVDVRVVGEENYGAALVYFTGSKAHNIELRERALDRDLKINEYGVFPGDEDESVAGKTEEEVYESVDLQWIPPELRENRGEIDAAENDTLPSLITIDDLKGDLHCHTTYTDGKHSIREMAEAAKKLGHEYIAITDHSKRVTVANGLDAKAVEEQIEEIERINEEMGDFTILKGIEVDILEDGSLDLPDTVLKKLDLCVCSLHYKLGISREKQTRRVLKAMDNPCFNIWAHPTSREIHKREPVDIDMEKIMKEVADRGILMEINSSPRRLDLNDVHCKRAKEAGIQIAISTDSHAAGSLKQLKYGVNQARRGWIEAGDVINTRSAAEVKEMMSR